MICLLKSEDIAGGGAGRSRLQCANPEETKDGEGDASKHEHRGSGARRTRGRESDATEPDAPVQASRQHHNSQPKHQVSQEHTHRP